jgi:hypothetical protein
MAQSKIVAHYLDGRIEKGLTNDFAPGRPKFHLTLFGAPSGSKPVEIELAKLKAVYFVKDFAGDPERDEVSSFDPRRPPVPGRRIRVRFQDGEQLVGTTQGYHPDRIGFFVIPADSGSNNERCFVVLAAAEEVTLL